MKPMLWPTLILALTALPLAAHSQSGRGPHLEKIASVLNLTEAQKVSIQTIREKHRPDLARRRDTVQQAHAALRAALQDAATPEAQLRALHDKASAAQFEMMLARRSVRQEVQTVLTPEQRIKAAELRGPAQTRQRERMRHPRLGLGMAG